MNNFFSSLFSIFLLFHKIIGFSIIGSQNKISAYKMMSDTDSQFLTVKTFLNSITSSRTAKDKKDKLITQFKNMRSSSTNAYISFLDQIILETESVNSNRWAMYKWPIPLPSYRLKLGSLLRVFNLILSEEIRVDMMDESNLYEKKRRAMSVLINQLKDANSIRSLENEAVVRLNRNSMAEMLRRTPKGLETPKYDVVESKSFWEVRKYQPFTVCTTKMDDGANTRGPGSFNELAKYIFGGNKAQLPMAMTTPVITTGDDPSSSSSGRNSLPGRRMSFVMPSAYWGNQEDLAKAPMPLDSSTVTLEINGGGLTADSETVAVLWFGGYATKKIIQKKTEELFHALADTSNQKWKIKEGVQPFTMQYNDPFQPPWSRRNEVAIPVVLK